MPIDGIQYEQYCASYLERMGYTNVKVTKASGDFGGLYDVIYAMHGTYSVSPDIVLNLIEGAEAVRDGRVSGTPINIHGHDVCLYSFPYAEFLCDLK